MDVHEYHQWDLLVIRTHINLLRNGRMSKWLYKLV